MSDARAPFADRRLLARAGIALLLANARYWSTVAPLVRAQLARWERRAEAIGDPRLRTPALDKLRGERFNVQSAATLATLAPRTRRASATRAIVALQVMYDYLDVLGEQPLADPTRDGHRLFTALRDALTLELQAGGSPPERQAGELEPHIGGDYYRYIPQADDGGYLGELVRTVRLELSRLPAAAAVAAVARESAARCAQAQVLSHAAARGGTIDELELWAGREAAEVAATTDTALGWPEYLAGAAASVLALHALIAAAADVRTTPRDAVEIDAAYLSIGALSMLDSLIDRDADLATGQLSYAQLYESPEAMATALVGVVRVATRQARPLPHAAHHAMTLVGVVAYYASAPAARSAFAQPVTARLIAELRPLITPTLALMRAWRLAKRVRQERPASARYVAIIADGNRRWARARGEPIQQGYEAGADTLKARLRDAVELGIEELTVYSFSTENWSRPAAEVEGLVAMLAERIARETPELHAQGVRMRFLGAREGVSPRLVSAIDWAESLTGANRRMTLFVAFNYGGRAEILDAARRFTAKPLAPQSEEAEFRKLLYAPDMHDPDVIIRTGGECRLSNYLLWQSAYAELVFRDELWPDFTRAAFEQSLRELDERKRRFGGRAPHHDGVAGVTTVPGRGRER